MVLSFKHSHKACVSCKLCASVGVNDYTKGSIESCSSIGRAPAKEINFKTKCWLCEKETKCNSIKPFKVNLIKCGLRNFIVRETPSKRKRKTIHRLHYSVNILDFHWSCTVVAKTDDWCARLMTVSQMMLWKPWNRFEFEKVPLFNIYAISNENENLQW